MLATTLPDRASDLRCRPAGDRPRAGVDLSHGSVQVDTSSRALAETARERLDPDCLPPAVLADMLASCGWGRVTVLGDTIESGVGDPVDGYRDVSWIARVDDAGRGRDVTRHVTRPVTRHEGAPRRPGDVDATTDLVVVSARADDVITPGLDPRIGAEVDAAAGARAARGALVVALGPLDISCGVRTMLSGLQRDAIEPVKDQVAEALFRAIPAGVGSTGKIRLDDAEMDAMLAGGAAWFFLDSRQEPAPVDEAPVATEVEVPPDAGPGLGTEVEPQTGTTQITDNSANLIDVEVEVDQPEPQHRTIADYAHVGRARR